MQIQCPSTIWGMTNCGSDVTGRYGYVPGPSIAAAMDVQQGLPIQAVVPYTPVQSIVPTQQAQCGPGMYLNPYTGMCDAVSPAPMPTPPPIPPPPPVITPMPMPTVPVLPQPPVVTHPVTPITTTAQQQQTVSIGGTQIPVIWLVIAGVALFVFAKK